MLLLLAAPATLVAQVPSSWTPPPTPKAIELIREADLRRDLFAMASPEMRGREGGTIDELKASAWVAEEYRKAGLEPAGPDGSWYQWFNIVRTRVSLTSSSVNVSSADDNASQRGPRFLELYKDIIPLGVTAVRAGSDVMWLSDPADTTVSIRGRVVATALQAPAPSAVRPFSYPYWNRYATAAINATLAGLSRRGAAAILLVADSTVDANFDGLAVMRGRGSYDVEDAPRMPGGPRRLEPLQRPGEGVALSPAGSAGQSPAFMVRAAMGATLKQRARAFLVINLERFEVPSVNVIGRVRGTDPALRDEHVLFSSHQDANGVRLLEPNDSILAGADDNASTTVAQLAAARAFVVQKPRRSVLFVNHGAEERGLLGSRYHAWHPVVPIEKIVAVLNGDMIGRNHPDTAGLLGSQPPHRNSMDLVRMALAANSATGKFVIDSSWDRPDHYEGFYFRSDHAPYARRNVPAVYWTAMLHTDYHTARDVPERIDYGKLTRMARWMYLTGWYAANAAQRPALDARPASAQDEFWSRLEALCGNAYAGRLAEGGPSDSLFRRGPLVMHARSCSPGEIRIALHVDQDRSRTWVLTRTASGLRLKHDHRHRDGSEDAVTQYGGDTRQAGSARTQEFPADAHTASLIPAARTNVWTVEVVPGQLFVYALRREGTDRRVRLEFDLSRSVPAPPAPW